MSYRNNNVRVSFVRTGGESIVLGSGAPEDKIMLLKGMEGVDIAPVSYEATPVLAGHGSTLQGKRLNERKILIPVLLDCNSFEELNALKARLMRVLSPANPNPLTLRIQVPGREKWREIPVHYLSGLEGNYDNNYHTKFEQAVIEFVALDAYWREEPQHIQQKVDPGTKGFLQAEGSTESFLPIILADSTVDAQIAVTVGGDAPTYPIWTITPPGSDLKLIHTTSGVEFFIQGLIQYPITINMEKGTLSSPGYTRQELWAKISEDSDMFALNPGRNYIDFSMPASSPNSLIHVVYQPRYLGGHA